MKKHLPPFLYAALALAVMAPLYRPGYLFLLDMVMTPQLHLAQWMQNGAWSPQLLLGALVVALSHVLPIEIIQKLLLTFVLFLPGLTMERLARRFLPFPWTLASGLLFMLNPWVYERFLAGHWLVLLGYGMFPVLAGWLTDLSRSQTRKNFWRAACLLAAYPLINLHWAYMAWGFTVTGATVWFCLHRTGLTPRSGRIIFRHALYLLACALLANSFWLAGFSKPHQTFPEISADDFAAFETRSDQQWGVWVNALALYGFWNDEYILPKDTLALWPLIPLAILLLSAAGGYALIKKPDRLASLEPSPSGPLGLTLAILFVPVLLIGAGYGSPITKPLVAALAQWVPGFKGLRETEKLLGILAFVYALCAPLGLARLIERCLRASSGNARGVHRMACALLCLLALAQVHTVFWGFSGQLTPARYPASWEQANRILAADPTARTALFLPWHGYLAFPFTRLHRVGNPAPRYFDTPVIAARSVDNAFLLARDQTEWDRVLFRLVQGVSRPEDEEEFFRAEQVTHVILARDAADGERYGFLDASPLFSPLFSSGSLTLYRIVPGKPVRPFGH